MRSCRFTLNKLLELMIILIIAAIYPSGARGEESTSRPPVKCEIRLISTFDGIKPEYVFLVDDLGFKSTDRLESYLGELPFGSEVVWDTGEERKGNEPLLSSEADMKAFENFLGSKGIKLTRYPQPVENPAPLSLDNQTPSIVAEN